MNFKQFLKPNWKKILITLVFSGIAAFLTFTPLVPYIIFLFYPAMLIFYNIPIYFTIVIFILISYPFSCYLVEKKKLIAGMILYLIAFIIISTTFVFLIAGYNKIFGHSCNSNSDCGYICGVGAVNKKFIYLRDPSSPIIDCLTTVAFCENKKCKRFSLDNVKSLEDCERIKRIDSFLYKECIKKFKE